MKPKSMRNLEDIMADYIANPDTKLSPDEERLLDLKVHEKTGKRIGKFKNPKKQKTETMLVLSKDGGQGQFEPKANGQPKKEPRIDSKVIVAGLIS